MATLMTKYQVNSPYLQGTERVSQSGAALTLGARGAQLLHMHIQTHAPQFSTLLAIYQKKKKSGWFQNSEWPRSEA